MSIVSATNERPEASLFSDGIGERTIAADGATGELLQILRIRPELTAVPSFEFALRERTARLANFRHAYYARVRRIDRVPPPMQGLAVVSDHIEGTRLSDVLRVAHERSLQLDINAALCLIRQLLPAVSLLHENARDVAHGLIAPERLVITPHARVVIVEHVLGSAIEQLQFSRERLWKEFRVALPPSAGLPRFDHRADVTGMALVALALIIGRPLAVEEFPNGLGTLLNEARERSALGDEQPLSQGLRTWLARALQLDVRRAFASAPEALAAFEEVVSDGSMYVAGPVALETFLSRFTAALLDPLPTPVTRPDFEVPAPAPATPAADPYADFTRDYENEWIDPEPAKPEPLSDAPAFAPAPAPAPAPFAPAPAPFAPAPALSTAPAAPPAPAAPSAPAAPAAPDPISAIDSAPDLTALLPPDVLKDVAPEAKTEKNLFNPDSPFTVGAAAEETGASEGGGRSRKSLVIAFVALLALVGGGALAAKFWGGASPTPSAPAMGTLNVQSNPSGVQIFLDGVDRGMTPARLSVTPGAHILELRGRGVPRVIPITVTAGAQLSQYLEFAETPTTGQLSVESQPAGAKVIVDGAERGVAPLTITDLAPGTHEVLLQTDAGTSRHVVNVQAGATAALVAPVAPAGAPISGWVTVKAPFTIEIYEQGRLLGTTDTDRIMMAAGRHELELVNTALSYRATRPVQVPAGKVATLQVELPHGVVNLNAQPWAEVWIDGQRVGETPIGNLGVAIGPHEVIFRHPQFGERRHAISVTLGAPVRLSVDMNKQ